MKRYKILLFLALLFMPVVSASGNGETYRWYAGVWLLEPTDATAVGGKIYLYDNIISDEPFSFVAFRLVLVRVDTLWNTMEWLEVGYFENATGFYIYSASFILDGSGYTELTWDLSSPVESGSGYLNLWIGHESGKTFRTYMMDAGIGVWLLQEATFTIGGINMFCAESESNDPYNSMVGHYDNLWWSRGEEWSQWETIYESADYPYSVRMASTDEFYSTGGYALNSEGSGGYGGSGGRKKK